MKDLTEFDLLEARNKWHHQELRSLSYNQQFPPKRSLSTYLNL